MFDSICTRPISVPIMPIAGPTSPIALKMSCPSLCRLRVCARSFCSIARTVSAGWPSMSSPRPDFMKSSLISLSSSASRPPWRAVLARSTVFLDQLFRIHRFVQEGLDGNGCRAEKLAEAELHHRYENGSAEHDEQRRRIEESARRAAEKNRRHNDTERAYKPDKSCEIQSLLLCRFGSTIFPYTFYIGRSGCRFSPNTALHRRLAVFRGRLPVLTRR